MSYTGGGFVPGGIKSDYEFVNSFYASKIVTRTRLFLLIENSSSAYITLY